MLNQSSPPWDASFWVIVDHESLLANLQTLNPLGKVVDFRSPFLLRLASLLSEDLKRLGVSGFFVSEFPSSLHSLAFLEGWQGYLAPPLSSVFLEQAAEWGLVPFVGNSAEAIHFSNLAQRHRRRLNLGIRLRDGDLLGDTGQTGFLPIVEMLPSLPMIEVQAVFVENPFRHRRELEAFLRAMGTHFGEPEGLTMLVSTGAAFPTRYTSRILLPETWCALDRNLEGTAICTIQTWAIPATTKGEALILTLDLGSRHGFPTGFSSPVFVEGLPAKVLEIAEYRTLVQIPHPPGKPGPWVATILGNSGIQSVSPTDWPAGTLLPFLEKICRNGPVFLRRREETRPVPPA